MSPLRWRWPDL